MITIDDFKKVEMKAGKIVSAESIEGSEKLLKLSVDFGPASAENSGEAKEEKRDIRQVVSGIAKFFSPEELVGITCAFVTNLEPRAIMGLESQAMIMAVSGNSPAGESFSLLKVSSEVPAGSVVK
jgi:methionine--tRNA ligase beta chain